MTCTSLTFPALTIPAVTLLAPIRSVQGPLLGSELSRAADMSERRRREFTAGRTLARQALRRLGGSDAIMLPTDAHGAPRWPEGVTGSIAHAGEMVIAVVAHHQDRFRLGVDLEPDLALPDDAAEWVITPQERTLLADAPMDSASRWLFCAKESVHKALNPLNGAWLEFNEIGIEPSADWSTFRVSAISEAAHEALRGLRLEGHFQRWQGYAVALLSAGK